MAAAIMVLMVLVATFLILLVLVQRGRGGGLAGAFGGMGGQSAFGTKAGDLFTRVTIVVAAAWILLCVAADRVLSTPGSRLKMGGSTETRGAAGAVVPPTTPGAVGETQPGAAAPADAAPVDAAPDGGSPPSGGSTPAATETAPSSESDQP